MKTLLIASLILASTAANATYIKKGGMLCPTPQSMTEMKKAAIAHVPDDVFLKLNDQNGCFTSKANYKVIVTMDWSNVDNGPMQIMFIDSAAGKAVGAKMWTDSVFLGE